jgi:hypothetical protein
LVLDIGPHMGLFLQPVIRAAACFGLWSENSKVIMRGMRGLITSS